MPVLVDGARTLHDCWAIAEYLEDAYPHRPSLFGGPEAQAVTRFVNAWTDSILHPWIARMVVRDILDCLRPEDAGYFRESREKRFGTTLEAFVAPREAQPDELPPRPAAGAAGAARASPSCPARRRPMPTTSSSAPSCGRASVSPFRLLEAR